MIRELYTGLFGSANWAQLSPKAVSIMRGKTEFTYILDVTPTDDDYVLRRALVAVLNINKNVPSRYTKYKGHFVSQFSDSVQYAMVRYNRNVYLVDKNYVTEYPNIMAAKIAMRGMYV